MSLLELNLLRLFIAVVDNGSFIGAANALQLPSSNISRAIHQLETQLNSRLIERTTRRMRLTEQGQLFYQHSKKICHDLENAVNLLSETQELRGCLRITIPSESGSQLLGHILARFALAHPQLALQCDTQLMPQDVIDDDIDLLLTFHRGQLTDSSYHAKKIKTWQSIVVASPELIKKTMMPQKIEQLTDLPCISSFSAIKGQPWQFIEPDGSLVKVNIKSQYRVNSGKLATIAAIEGVGFAILAKEGCEEELKSGRLIEVNLELSPAPIELIALYASRLYLSPKVTAFLAFLQQSL